MTVFTDTPSTGNLTSSSRCIVLFDMDGTLTASDPGILASFARTLQQFNIPVPDAQELRYCIGPTIVESLLHYGISSEHIDEAYATYRNFYDTAAVFDNPLPLDSLPNEKVPGMFLNALYDGIVDQLARLSDSGYELAVCTCKPESPAQSIARRFHITSYFTGIYGASMDQSRVHKDQVISYGLRGLGYQPQRGDRAIMVGDRSSDILGARACGLPCIGCGWGYAKDGELAQCDPYSIAASPADLYDAVSAYFNEKSL